MEMATPKKISALELTPSLPIGGEFPVSINGKTWKATIEQLVVLAGYVASQVAPEIVVMNSPDNIVLAAGTLLDKVVVESATSQPLTIERVSGTADLIDNDGLAAGVASVYQLDQWGGASGVTIYFKDFTDTITLYLFKRG
jgi:hypothetical protein